jgi:hypothetical protein
MQEPCNAALTGLHPSSLVTSVKSETWATPAWTAVCTIEATIRMYLKSQSLTAAFAGRDQSTTLPSVSDRLPVVYILGAGHSGSTLLALLLGAHPEICTVGEVKAPAVADLQRYTCSCGQEVRSCEFWQTLAREVEKRGSTLELSGGASDVRRATSAYVRRLMRPLHRGAAFEALRDLALATSPSWSAHLKRVQTLTASLASSACAVTGKRVFVDSSKTGLQLKYLLRNPSLDVKVIRLVRDGRGVSLSYHRADQLSIADAAYAWRRTNEEAGRIVRALPADRWFDLRYEELCRDVEGTMHALLSFIGVAPVAVGGLATSDQHVLGNNKMRLTASEVRLDEKWRRTLTPDDLETFDRVAGSLNRQLGYL